jgi:hypothetical protein
MAEYEIARRVPRYPFVADAAVADTYSKTYTKARTATLGLYGCGIVTSKPLPQGTGVRITLFYRGAEVKAVGIVAYVRADLDMGIAFTDLDQESERILDGWITELRHSPARKT